MTRRTRALSISESVKEAVWDRDGGQCIICGSRNAGPWCHYISRAQGGKGIPENVFTGCSECHRKYDQTEKRPVYREMIREYLMSKYPDWDEEKLIYRKEDLI